eukprot:44447-Eustigmatos_ZCMA.PRE.1
MSESSLAAFSQSYRPYVESCALWCLYLSSVRRPGWHLHRLQPFQGTTCSGQLFFVLGSKVGH